MSIAPGTKPGRYEIRTQLGAGGMGEVYLVQDMQLERTIALKILPADVTSDRQQLLAKESLKRCWRKLHWLLVRTKRV